MIQQQIETVLQVLIGLPWCAAGRVADLEWFHFGSQHTVTTHDGQTRTVGDYALHIQCAWRIRTSFRIIVASNDLYYPADETLTDDDNFHWDVPGANLCDRKMAAWLQAFAGHFPIVQKVTADNVGSVSLFLSDDQMIEIFPDDSLTDEYSEHWRFFKPGTDDEHFVLSGKDLLPE
jgi:hypothetical protein